MELKSFAEFQKLLSEVEGRMQVLQGEISSMQADLTAQLKSFDEAVVEGADPEELQHEIESLELKLRMKQREDAALTAAIGGKAKGGKLVDAAKAVWEEGTNLITGPLREEWEATAAKAGNLKEAFLAVVAELGHIKARADSIHSKLAYGIEGFTGGKFAAPSLSTGIYKQHKQGIIYITPAESERAFKKGA